MAAPPHSDQPQTVFGPRKARRSTRYRSPPLVDRAFYLPAPGPVTASRHLSPLTGSGGRGDGGRGLLTAVSGGQQAPAEGEIVAGVGALQG